MEQNMITIRNLSKEFKGQSVLKNITMEIPKNCVYGLLGANGAGKSTLLKTITGLLNPTSGEIYFEGHKWTRADLADIGALIETPPIYENLTAWENMKVRALLLGIPDEKIQEVLKTVDLTDTGKKKAGAFSLGMKQRLGIGLALLNDPKLLVLDEPVNGLDPLGIQELRALIRSFPQKGITVIISSHILSEIQQTADYIGIIAKGTVGFEGKLQEQQDLEALFMKVVAKEGMNHETLFSGGTVKIPSYLRGCNYARHAGVYSVAGILADLFLFFH